MQGEKIHLVLNVSNSHYIEYAGFVRLRNNPGANQQCKSPKKASWSSDQEVHTPAMAKASASVFVSQLTTGMGISIVMVRN